MKKYKFRNGNTPHNKGLTHTNSEVYEIQVTNFVKLTLDEYDLVTKSPTSKHSTEIPVSMTSVQLLCTNQAAKTEVENVLRIKLRLHKTNLYINLTK